MSGPLILNSRIANMNREAAFRCACLCFRTRLKESRIFEETFQAGERTGWGIERREERLPSRGNEAKSPPVRECLIGTHERAFQHEFADRPMRPPPQPAASA